jgi:hypothetical protein
MATIYSAILASKRPTLCAHARRAYLCDGFTEPQVWDGVSAAMENAGIAGPSRESTGWTPAPTSAAGTNDVTAGTHLVRYRYQDSRTGFVSDPSNTYSLVADGASKYTFPIDTATATNILRSSTNRVDRIVVEMTLAGGATFFVAAIAAEAATSVEVDISDRQLVAKRLPWSDDGHLMPPITAHVFSYRGRLWFYGQVPENTGTVAVTNGSATVTGTGTAWGTGALGANNAASQRSRRILRVASDALPAEIRVGVSSTQLTLTEVYPGTTLSGLAYVIYSLEGSRIWYSQAGFPESVPLQNFVDGPALEPTRAAIGVLNGILLMGLSTTSYYRYTDNPALDGSLRQVSADRGSTGHHVTLNVDEVVYTLDRRGFTSWSGDAPVAISRPIETVVARINFAVENTFHAACYPRSREIRWCVALDSDTTPGHYVAWNVQRRTWSMGTLEVVSRASALVQTASATKVVTGDANGHVWLDDVGTTGGSDSNPRGLATAAATTTVIPFSNITTLPTTGAGLTGVTAYFERLNETRVVSANTASQVTVSVAFSSAPRAGDVIWLGRVKALLKTKAFVLGEPTSKHRGRFVHVWFVPQTSQRFARVRIYRDWSTTAMSFSTAHWRRDSNNAPRSTIYPDPDDAGAQGDSTDWRIDLSDPAGVVRLPLGDETVRVTTVEIEVFQADCRVELLGVTIDAEPRESLV